MSRRTDINLGERRSGRWIATLEGYRAFHPDPLPPVLNWSPQMASALADASLRREQGIITAATEAKRGRVFCAKAILDILEEPARLTPVLPPQPASSGDVPQV